MKFLVSYRERRADPDPAAAGRRVSRSLNERPMPPGLTVHQLLSRIGGGGGFAVVETADSEDLQHLASLFAAYECRVEPVTDVAYNGSARAGAAGAPTGPAALPEMPPDEPHEGAFSDDDVYDTED